MTPQILVDPLPFLLQHELFAVHEVADADALHGHFHRIAKSALAESGEMKRRLAQRLRWNRAGVDARAAQHRLALDERDALAEVRGLGRSLLAGRPGADHDEVVHGTTQYSINECTIVPSSFFRPSRNVNSMTMEMPTSVAPKSRTSAEAAAAVPPVASTSSMITTRSVGARASS